MAKVVWGSLADRFFEAGVDRGVLYPAGGIGVPWNGLIKVTETPSGAELTSYYQDGVKYLNVRSAEEFGGSIEAFAYPDAFAECDGTFLTSYGFEIAQQQRKEFGLSYRTLIGNSDDGLDHGYKLHLIYNALAAPSQKTYSTVGSSVEPITFTWDFTTTPMTVGPGMSPTAHVILDSRKVGPEMMNLVETALYGSPTANPKLLTIPELIALILQGFTLQIVDNMDGSWTAYGTDAEISFLSPSQFQISSPSVTKIDNTSYILRSISD